MMSDYKSSYYNPDPYVPQSLSEIDDLIGSMWLRAPTFVDETGLFPDDIDSVFHELVEGFCVVRKKLGEERYAKLIDLAARAKALFAADPEDSNGKANEGRTVLSEIEDVIREVRSRRVRAKLKDDEGEVTGD